MLADAPRTTADASAELSALVAETPTSAIPAAAFDAARGDLLDTIGCAVAGRRAAGVEAATGVFVEWGGASISSVWGTGTALPPPAAAFLNAMNGHALDYDDMHPGVTHTGVSVIPAALAVAEQVGCFELDELLAAIILGTEVADRIAVSVTDGPGETGWLLTPLVGYFGAAAAAARMYGLDAHQTRHALGFAYVQASGNGQSTLDGALAKRMQPGFASRGGVVAARLAQAGLTAPLDGLEGRRGFFHVYHRDRYDPAVLRTGHLPAWMIEQATYKPYPCCGWTHAALECALQMRQYGVSGADVTAVTVQVNEQAYQSTGTPLPRRYHPRTQVDAQFSIPYIFATALQRGSVELTDFEPEALERGDVIDLAQRVVVVSDPALAGALARDVSPARAEVTTGDGAVRHASVRAPIGISRPLGAVELVEKFRGCCRYAGRSEEFATTVATLALEGSSGAVTALIAALGGAPR